MVNLFTIFLLVTGGISFYVLNRDVFPQINFDMVSVSAYYSGAAPAEIEKLITIPLERELDEVDDIKEMTSVSVEGYSNILIKIDPDAKNKSKIVNDIQRAVDSVGDLPTDLLEDPVVREFKTENTQVVELTLSGSLDEIELQKHVKVIEDDLLNFPEVAKVIRRGWRDSEIWVEVEPQKTHDYYISLLTIVDALKKKNVNIAAGTLFTGSGEVLVRTSGEYETPKDVENTILRANLGGGWVRLGDIAQVSRQFETEKTISRTDGRRAIALLILKRSSADAIKTVAKVKEYIEQYTKRVGGVLEANLVNDLSYYVKRRLNVMYSNGWLGMIMVIFILFLFDYF